MVAVKLFSVNSKTLHYAAIPYFDGFCFSISLQYNENGEKQIFIFHEPPTFIFFHVILWDYILWELYYPFIAELHCTVVIEVIFLFRVARDVFYPPCPRLPQNLAKQTYREMSGISRNELSVPFCVSLT